jgi:hypothetical protein
MNSLNWEHLADKKDILRAWIYNIDQFRAVKAEINSILEGKVEVNYFWESDYFNKHNMLSAWSRTYVFSDCDSLAKFSTWYMDCTWVVMIWNDKNTWKNISILSHQDPTFFLKSETNKEIFIKDLLDRLRLIKSRSADSTIDISIFWWYFSSDYPDFAYVKYIESIKLLDEIIKNEFWFNPVIIMWPKLDRSDNHLEVHLDTENRHLYMVRPEQKDNIANHSLHFKGIKDKSYFMWWI